MLVRDRFVFEAADTFGGDPALADPAGTVEDGAGAGQAADAPVPSGGEPPAPSWADSLESREAIAEAANAAAEARFQALLEEHGINLQEPADDDDGFDPSLLDPYSEEFGVNLIGTPEQRMQALLDAKLAPIEQQFQREAAEREQQQLQHGNELIEDVLADIQARPDSLGEFAHPDSKQQAIDLGDQLVGRYMQAGYPPPKAAELALSDAYRQVRERENALMAKGEEMYRNRMATLAGAQGQPGAAVAGVEQAPDGFTSVAELGRYLDQRRRPSA